MPTFISGRKLVPHWRFAKGIDIKEFFVLGTAVLIAFLSFAYRHLASEAERPRRRPEAWSTV